jgi:hypothetical protein
MSANIISALVGDFDDPRQVQLVKKLNEKTRQGKVPWVRSLNAMTANLSDGLSMNFVLQANVFGRQPAWELFVIRDSKDNEILRVHSVGVFQSLVGNPNATLLQSAVDELFSSIMALIGDEIEKAIRIIDKI